MPDSFITGILSQAGIRLLNTLIDRAQDYGERTDDPVYVILEHWALALLEPDDLRVIFDAAQEQFCTYADAHSRWLSAFAELLENGGDGVPAFAETLWLAYFFRLESAADALWTQYPEIQRTVTLKTSHSLPRSWGDWVFPMQTFMGTAENLLIDYNPVFEQLLISEDVVTLFEEPVEERGPAEPLPALGVTFVSGEHLDASATLITYLTACVQHIGHIDPRGYPRSVHRTVPLGDVYIPLRLVPFSACDRPDHYVRYQTATYDHPELHLFREPLSSYDLEKHPGVAIGDVLVQHDQVLILGESGSGKTTLLRHMVYDHARILLDHQECIQVETRPGGVSHITLAHPVPVYIELSDYTAGRLSDDQTLQDFILQSAADLTQDTSTGPLLKNLIEGGQCLILLDGLDQVATDEQRRLLVSSVVQAVGYWRAAGNQIVVASRFAGYDVAPLPPEFKGYIVRTLDRSQIGPFLLRWAIVLARMRRPLISDDEAIQQAEMETLMLAREVTTNPRLHALANNPLTLRVLVGVFRPGMYLPSHRAAIYQMVADALIREWHLPQSAAGKPVVVEQEAVSLLGELAFWLQTSRPCGMLSEVELHNILGHTWGQMHPDASPDLVEEAVTEFVARLRMQTGVLCELSPQRYGFIYHGLQEYFAARHMVASYRMATDRIRAFLHDPRWDEVIRLAIGFTALRSREDASDLLETAILARGTRAEQLGYTPSPFEDLLKRDLFFAARLMGSGIEPRPDVTSEIVARLIDLWLNGDRDDLGRFSSIFDCARRYLVHLDGTSASHRALQIVRQHLSEDHDEHVRAYATDAVTFWPTHFEEARDALIECGRHVPVTMRRAMVGALGRVGSLSIDAYRLLLALVNDTDEQVSQVGQQTLRNAAPAPHDALGILLDFLRSDDRTKRRVSLRVLRRVGALPRAVIDELLHLLSDPEVETRQAAISVLGDAINLPDNALMVICRFAMDTRSGMRVAAINALRRPALLPEEVISYLVDWTYDPSDVAAREAAALALGTCLNTSPDVMEALVERLDDEVDSVRAAVVEPLALKGRDNPRVMHVLSHAVSDSSYTVRCAIARALGQFPYPDDETRQALTTLLSDREVIVREAALEAIARLEDPGKEIIDYLVSLVSVQEHGIGTKAIAALAALRGLPDEALLALVRALPLYWEVHGESIRDCLQAHVPLNIEIVDRVMDLAVSPDGGAAQPTRLPPGLGALALEILGYAQNEAPDMTAVLLRVATSSKQSEVRVAALRGLIHARTIWPDMKEKLLSLLDEESLEVRCAAAITLGHLVRNIPDPPFQGRDLLALAKQLAALLGELRPHAAWEVDTGTQNDLLLALSWTVARARPAPPRLAARLEE